MTRATKATEGTVFIVDDNAAVRDAIRWLVEQVGLTARTYGAAQEFLSAYRPGVRGCLVLDIRMPGMSGLDLQERLLKVGATLPIIFVTGHGDVPVTVRAMKAGAIDFLQKPFNDNMLLDAIFAAIRQSEEMRAEEERRAQAAQGLAALTAREREVLRLLRGGKSSKLIAADMGISVRTVEGYRANIMDKMNARTVGQLVEMVINAKSSG